VRATVHVAGRPDPDGKQRCIVCRHELTGSASDPTFPMGRDVNCLDASDGIGRGLHMLEDPGSRVVTVRCTAL
jgi:hypothetical protein